MEWLAKMGYVSGSDKLSSAMQPKDVRGPANLEAMSKWKCPNCGESHYHTYLKCSKCNTFKPSQAHSIVNKQACRASRPHADAAMPARN